MNKQLISSRLFLTALLATAFYTSRAETLWLDELDVSQTQQDWGVPRANLSVDGNPLKIADREFDRGLGTHASSALVLQLDGSAQRFTAFVGVDNEVQGQSASVEFKLTGDGRVLWRSGKLTPQSQLVTVDVPLNGVKTLVLGVTDSGDGINYDHADWAEAKIEYAGAKPTVAAIPREEPYILTPPAPPTPRINGARIVGCRPGNPFLFTIPATGNRPMTFSVDNLPEGLDLNPTTGLITGAVKKRGETVVTLHARNALGTAERSLKIVCGDTIALTPPMGWNSWNCFASAVTTDKVKAAANAMVQSGLTQHGWTYINIDDFWEKNPGSDDPSLGGPGRNAQGYMVPNPRFPDMKSLCDSVHDLGLKIGIYSSPGPLTCGGCLGSYDHEFHDARSYAEWGIDYLKYDWCSYRPALELERTNQVEFGKWSDAWKGTYTNREELMRPYSLMREALDQMDRDIVYSLCQYGMGDVWEWGARVGGNCWRTTGDITDTWGSMSSIGFGQAGHEKNAKPGNWNDPDMLVVGQVGWGPRLHPSRLTPSEQYTHISLWCLLASPLLIGCDMTQLDDFTLNLLTNDEVLEVNQDPSGHQAGRVSKNDDLEVWAKQMEDGSYAVGLFNRGEVPMKVTAAWSDLSLTGSHRVRDLWRQKDLGEFENGYQATVPRHGVVLVRVY